MHDFFARLIARSNGDMTVARPLTAAMFAQGPFVAEEKAEPMLDLGSHAMDEIGEPMLGLNPTGVPETAEPTLAISPAVPRDDKVRTGQDKIIETPRAHAEAREISQSVSGTFEKTLPAAPANLPAWLRASGRESSQYSSHDLSLKKNTVLPRDTLQSGDKIPEQTNFDAPTEAPSGRQLSTTRHPAKVPLANKTVDRHQGENHFAHSPSPISYHESRQDKNKREAPLERPEGRTVRVTIGRVDVHAIFPSKETTTRTKSSGRQPPVSLEEYLKQRKAGQR